MVSFLIRMCLRYATLTADLPCGMAITPCLEPNNAGLSDFGAPVLISGPRILEASLRLGF